MDLDASGVGDRSNLAEDNCAPGRGGHRQGLAALDNRLLGNPAARPDQRAGFVVAAPDGARKRGDGEAPAAPDERGEDRRIVPAGKAHPGEVAPWAHQDSALAIGEQGILAQDVRSRRQRVSPWPGGDAHAKRRARAVAAAAAPTPSPTPSARLRLLSASCRERPLASSSKGPCAPRSSSTASKR